MRKPDDTTMKFLATAGRSIRATLKEIYGSAEAAETAIRDAMQAPKRIEQWATIAQKQQQRIEHSQPNFYFVPNVSLRDDEEWTFDAIPNPLRDAALASMAAAMLVWEHEQGQMA